jgi:magnesium transporter
MLLNCIVYEHGNKIADIAIPGIGDYLRRPGCFVWVALHDPTPGELAEVQQEFGLHSLAVEDARSGHQRPKVEEYGTSLFAVMHLLEPTGKEHSKLVVGEIDVFVGENYVVSVRNRGERGFAEVRERGEREPELMKLGPGYLLYALMDAVVDRYFPIIDAFEVELETIEQRIFTKGAAQQNVRRLYALKHRLTVLKHAVEPLLEGAGKLHGGRVPQLCVGLQAYFRDVVDHLGRINASIDAIRETISLAISVNLSMVTIEDGEVTKRLAAWAAIFAVCTSLVGVWGMNFRHMPELEWRYGYAAALGVIGALCGYLYYRFRRAGWV